MWTAYYQADGELRHEIATEKYRWTADFKAEEFIKRMANPEAQTYWVWVEETNGESTGEENNEEHLIDKPVEALLDIPRLPANPFGT